MSSTKTAAESSGGAEVPPTNDFPPGASTRGRIGIGRIAAAYALVGLAWAIPFLASIAVLLPAKLAELPGVDQNRTFPIPTIPRPLLPPPSLAWIGFLLPAKPAELPGVEKIGAFAILPIVGSIVALIANIVFGALSDRTRSRFGSRSPWIFGGAVGATLGLVILAISADFTTLLIGWLVLQVAQNAYLAATSAMIADRVAPHRQGLISGILGTSNTIAQAAGAIIGGTFATQVDTGFWTIAAIPLVGAIIILLLAPDSSNLGTHRIPLTTKTIMTTFAFPRKAPDFYWALFGRLLLILGFFSVINYHLFILTDYMNQSPAEAGATISMAGIITTVTGVVAGLIAGPISDKINRRKLPVLVASILIGIGAIVPFVAPQPWALIAFAGVAGFGMGMYWAVDVALVIRVLPHPGTRAKDLGILNMANTGGQILAPVIVATLVQVGGYQPIFLFGALCAIVSGFLILPIKSTR